jgi:hypothetical protein
MARQCRGGGWRSHGRTGDGVDRRESCYGGCSEGEPPPNAAVGRTTMARLLTLMLAIPPWVDAAGP